MHLKHVLLDQLDPEQLRALCDELEIETDRRSSDDMTAVLRSNKLAKPEKLIISLTMPQLRQALAVRV